MIRYIKGDIFESQASVLVNPVNCVGVMGAGLAREFKKRFPANYRAYDETCRKQLLKPGGYVLSVPHRKENPNHYILNIATKDHWRHDSTHEIINKCCKHIQEYLIKYNIPSIAIPALGCGNGKLEWTNVKMIMELHLHDVAADIEIYEPFK